LTNATITKGLPQASARETGSGRSPTAGAEGIGGSPATTTRPTSGTPDTAERGGTGTLSAGSPRVGEENPAGTTGLGTDPKAVDQTTRAAQSAAQSSVHTFKLTEVKK